MEENPFPGLNVKDFSFLESKDKRENCTHCGRSRKYYCYTCYKPINDFIADKIPKVKLPVKIDIIKHPSEVDGKSTSPHAAILAPDHVTVYDYPCIPDYDVDKTILIFPGPDSLELEEVLTSSKEQNGHTVTNKQENTENSVSEFRGVVNADIPNCDNEASSGSSPNSHERPHIGDKRKHETAFSSEPCDNVNIDSKKKQTIMNPWFEKVIFIDSTWNQTPTISTDERLKDIQRVEIKQRKTKFWRTKEGNPEEYLSTIEAIYYFSIDYHKLCINPVYQGQYDNLLFFFCFTYNKIRKVRGGGASLKAYSKKSKRKEGSEDDKEFTKFA